MNARTSPPRKSYRSGLLMAAHAEEHFYFFACQSHQITDAITSFISDKGLEYSRLVGQGYDGAATFQVYGPE